jgi:protein-L-isoaspartate(D-aspartate) O-methyltransferase
MLAKQRDMIVKFHVGFALIIPILWGGLARATDLTSDAKYTERRKELVERVLIPGGIRDEKVLQAVSNTQRHLFVPEAVREDAYLDRSLPIGEHQTISSPFIVALMTEILETQPTDRVLEIGTGSGYQAAILSPLVDKVYTIEIVAELQDRTTKLLHELGYKNIFTKTGDGYRGWPEHAPFDKIIVTCSPDSIPQPLVDQLREGGSMVIPVGERYQQMLRRLRKSNGKMVSDFERPTQFVPMTGVAESQRRDRPDGSKPRILNGDFEELLVLKPANKEASVETPKQATTSDAMQVGPVGTGTNRYVPHWYYEFGAAIAKDAKSPVGEHFVEFTNTKAGDPSMLLQGMPLDGRLVSKVRLSGWAMTRGVRLSSNFNEQPFIVLQYFDENRKHSGYHWLGPFLGDTPWKQVEGEFAIPVECRDAIVMIGLFGAEGTAGFDGLEIEVVEPRKQ